MLYHFSEDPAIERFVPRVPIHRPEIEPMVWAISEEHQQIYWVPRDCPRVYFWLLPTTTAEDRARFWTGVGADLVLAIEAAWVERLRTTQVYRYTLSPESFTLIDANYGAYVSRETVVPSAVEPMGNLLHALVAAPVELRLCPSLVPLGKAIIHTSFSWGLIRMRNAQGWTD